MSNAKIIADELAARASDVAAYLLPHGKKSGSEWKAGSVRGEPGTSLSVRISGTKKGVWSDFATDEKGDMLDLFAACRGLSILEAMREAAQWLGVTLDMPAKPAKTYARPAKPKSHAPKAGGLRWLTESRKLTAETVAAFKVGEYERDGKTYVVLPFLRDGEFINAKHRNVDDKRDMRQESGAEPCLFGWHLVTPRDRQIVLCEGEIDAMTLRQFGYCALSPNAGAGNFQWLENDWDRLAQFSDIVVAFDADEAGQKGAQEAIRRIGVERCRLCTFAGYKDANEALQAGEDGEFFYEAIRAAKFVDPEGLQSFGDFIGRVKSMFYPAPGSTEPGYVLEVGAKRYEWMRFRPGEVTVWTGINGHGKSQFIAQEAVQQCGQGARWCVFSGEMLPATQLHRLCRLSSGSAKPTPAYLDAMGEWLGERMWVITKVGSIALEPLLELFAYANRRYGCDAFLIDSLMMLDIPEDGNGAFTAQKKAVQLLADFAKRHGVHVHLVAHPRKGRDEKESPGKMDVAGSSKITDGADNVLTIWSAKRDPQAEGYDPEEIDGFVKLTKQRNGDVQERVVPLWSHTESRQFCSDARRRTVPLIPFDRQEVPA